MKKQKGITLVAMIIVIIVMIILAGVVIVAATMDGGIIDKAQTALIEKERAEVEDIVIASYIYKTTASTNIIGQLDLEETAKAIYLNLTESNYKMKTLTGEEAQIYKDIYSQEASLINLKVEGKSGIYEGIVEKNGLRNGIEIVEDNKIGGTVPPVDDGNNIPENNDEEVNELIPEGGLYKRVAEDGTETEYLAGEAFPETVVDGDIYIYEDYEYRYNCICVASTWIDIPTANQAFESEGINVATGGWGVVVTDTSKTEYTDMMSTINGKDVTNLVATYFQCNYLINSPKLSNKAKSMCLAFYECYSLTTVLDLPDSVTNLAQTFDQCYSLKNVPAIPSGVTNMSRTFGCCESLEKAPDMSKAVNITNMYGTFEECESLTGEIEINCNPTEYEYCFGKVNRSAITITGTASEATKQGLLSTARIK